MNHIFAVLRLLTSPCQEKGEVGGLLVQSADDIHQMSFWFH